MFAIADTAVTFCVRTSWPLCRSPLICSLPPGRGIAMVAVWADKLLVRRSPQKRPSAACRWPRSCLARADLSKRGLSAGSRLTISKAIEPAFLSPGLGCRAFTGRAPGSYRWDARSSPRPRHPWRRPPPRGSLRALAAPAAPAVAAAFRTAAFCTQSHSLHPKPSLPRECAAVTAVSARDRHAAVTQSLPLPCPRCAAAPVQLPVAGGTATGALKTPVLHASTPGDGAGGARGC